MANKNLFIIIAVIALLAVGGAVYYFMQQPASSNNPPAGSSDNNINSPETTPPASEGSQTYNIEISGFSFKPSELTIKTGDIVTWTNQDPFSHTITSDSGSELNSEKFGKGETYSHTFNTAGTYEYHCAPHPVMKGKIIVE